MVRKQTCCAAPEGVSDVFRGCLPRRHWGVCDRRTPASRCGRWAHPAGWARSGPSPLRSAAFPTTPPPWRSQGQWTTSASKCIPCHAGLGYRSPAEEREWGLAGDWILTASESQNWHSPEWPDWGPAAPTPASLTVSWGKAWRWQSAEWAEPKKQSRTFSMLMLSLRSICKQLFLLAWHPHLRALIMETLKKTLQQLVSVVNPLGVFPDNPDHGGTRVRLIQRVEVLTQCSNDAFIPEVHPDHKDHNLHTNPV